MSVPKRHLLIMCVVTIELFSLAAARLKADEQLPESTRWARPVAAVSSDGTTAYIAQLEAGKIMRLQTEAIAKGAEALQPFIETSATHIIDMQISQLTEELIMVCDQPPRLIRQPLAGAAVTTIALPAKPARVALSKPLDGKQQVCVTLPWSNAVWMGVLSQSSDMDPSHRKLDFVPKEVLALDEQRFMIADAFSGEVAIIHAGLRKVLHSPKLTGYHIAGLTHDSAADRILVAHQLLSSNAHTDKDDIRWGNLIQNNVAAIPVAALDEAKRRLTTDVNYRLGDFGHGSADPSGIVALGERFAVALSGMNEVAVYTKATHQAKYVTVGRVPDRLWRLGADHLLCLHRLDTRIAVINCAGETPRVAFMFGSEQQLSTAAQRGELAFYSGLLSHDGWMSCQSCHIDGHSPDLLVDTQGDGSFDSPKKIPSLDNVASTGPWAWHGGQATLRDQITKTLSSTMHMPDDLSSAAGIDPASLADDLVEYLSSLKNLSGASAVAVSSATDPASAIVSGGEALFQQHCGRCHDPDQHFTTPKSYDVGINDERGQKLFNPPSLHGLRYRQSFMHDGRYKNLDQILTNHPQPVFKFTPDEQFQLKSFLQRL